MPDSMDPLQPNEEQPNNEEINTPIDAPLDGVMPPTSVQTQKNEVEDQNNSVQTKENKNDVPATTSSKINPRMLLLMIIGVGGAFLFFYLFFAFYLFSTLPDPQGGNQWLKMFSNVFYGGVSILSVLLVAILAIRLVRSGMDQNRILQMMIRPGVVLVVVLGVAGMVFMQINKTIPLRIDILEPQDVRGLTAPVTVTFGTDSIRQVLRNQGITPKKYKWDFNGDNIWDAETTSHEVTTIYKKKGNFRIHVSISLSDGTIRDAWYSLSISHVNFLVDPKISILNEETTFDISNLVNNPEEELEIILWDMDGDGEIEKESTDLIMKHVFTELGLFQVQVTIQYIGGLQEMYSRTITVLEKREQPFDVNIVVDGSLHGSVPLGLTFTAEVEVKYGTRPRSFDWMIVARNEVGLFKNIEIAKTGERIHHVFDKADNYDVFLNVVNNKGQLSTTSVVVFALKPLVLKDIAINGSPKPAGSKVEGTSPLRVQLSASTNIPFITFSWEQENASAVYETEDVYHALYEKPGTYSVILIAKDEQERTQKIPLEINVLPPRSNVSFTAIPSAGIAPLTVTFDASDSFVPDGRITGFAWTFGDSNERNEQPKLLGAKVTHRYGNEGTYTAIVRALTEDGRSLESRKTIVVRTPTLNACILPSRISGGPAPMGVRFDASCSTGVIKTYLWSFGDGATSEQITSVQDHVFEKPGTYTVLLEVSDGEENYDEETVVITVE